MAKKKFNKDSYFLDIDNLAKIRIALQIIRDITPSNETTDLDKERKSILDSCLSDWRIEVNTRIIEAE